MQGIVAGWRKISRSVVECARALALFGGGDERATVHRLGTRTRPRHQDRRLKTCRSRFRWYSVFVSYKTVEVELEAGWVRLCGTESLPDKAHALLTILEPNGDTPSPAATPTSAGLRRFLSTPDFTLTPAQFRASMEVDFFDQ